MDAMVKLEIWKRANDVLTYDCIPYREAESIIEYRFQNNDDKYAHIQSLEHADLHMYYFVWNNQIGCDVTMKGAINVAQNPETGILI